MLKRQVRIAGIDDAPFSKKDKKVLCIATIFRGGDWLDGLLSFYVKRDGCDATNQLIRAINGSRHKEQLQFIMLDGICLGGFNVVDIAQVYEKTGLGVIAYMRKKPKMKKFLSALSKINPEAISYVKRAGGIKSLAVGKRRIYFQFAGCTENDVKELLRLSCTHGDIPEPLRVAHIIARGIVLGESKGKA